MVLGELNVAQVVLCGHSMGSILGGYIMDVYPQFFRGYINITGIVNYWYVGLKTFYLNVVLKYGFIGPKGNAMIRLLNKEEYREKHHARFVNDSRDVYFGPVQFPALTVTEMAAYIKIFSSIPGGPNRLYELNHKIKFLRVLIFGRKDPLHTCDLTCEQIYSITRGRFKFARDPHYSKVLDAAKVELESAVEMTFGIKIDASLLQDYFCYHFTDTGHNAHRRRPKEISKIIRVYLVVLKVLEKYETLTRSGL